MLASTVSSFHSCARVRYDVDTKNRPENLAIAKHPLCETLYTRLIVYTFREDYKFPLLIFARKSCTYVSNRHSHRCTTERVTVQCQTYSIDQNSRFQMCNRHPMSEVQYIRVISKSNLNFLYVWKCRLDINQRAYFCIFIFFYIFILLICFLLEMIAFLLKMILLFDFKNRKYMLL